MREAERRCVQSDGGEGAWAWHWHRHTESKAWGIRDTAYGTRNEPRVRIGERSTHNLGRPGLLGDTCAPFACTVSTSAPAVRWLSCKAVGGLEGCDRQRLGRSAQVRTARLESCILGGPGLACPSYGLAAIKADGYKRPPSTGRLPIGVPVPSGQIRHARSRGPAVPTVSHAVPRRALSCLPCRAMSGLSVAFASLRKLPPCLSAAHALTAY